MNWDKINRNNYQIYVDKASTFHNKKKAKSITEKGKELIRSLFK